MAETALGYLTRELRPVYSDFTQQYMRLADADKMDLKRMAVEEMHIRRWAWAVAPHTRWAWK